MKADGLTIERILDAAEDVLRRFGPRKTTVVDVARALGVSHGTVYRHVAGKKDLTDALTARWLHRLAEPLGAIATAEAPADVRLQRGLDPLVRSKHARFREDPEVSAAFPALAAEACGLVAARVGELVEQAAAILAAGIAEGVFAPGEPQRVARTVPDDRLRFHHAAHRHEWGDPAVDEASAHILVLVLRGLGRAP